jgi:nucleotide-binding universal stress UspA family protein
MEATPRWLVGLDLLPQNTGVLRFGAWLGRCRGVHVVETGLLRFVGEELSTVLEGARASMERSLAEAEARAVFEGLQAVASVTAERGLIEAAAREQPTALVIGRWSRRGERGLVRLGRVARRILRELPTAVIVTPPDLQASQIGAGPLLVATDLSEGSAAAYRFAAALAAEQGRGVVLVHVAVPIEHAAIYTLDRGWEALRAQEQELVRREVEAWVAAHAAGASAVEIRYGAVEEQLLALAAALDAPLIVTGSRRLSLAERIFGSSLASSLAGVATCPVAVVPPA